MRKSSWEWKNEIGKVLDSLDNLKDNVKEMSHNAEQNDKETEQERKAKRSKINLWCPERKK